MFFLLLSLFPSTSAQCSYNKGDLSIRWGTTPDQQIQIEFINKNLTNNQWTAIAWGENMNDLEVVAFEVVNGHPLYVRTYTTGYKMPNQIDDSICCSDVNIANFYHQETTLTARISRPLASTKSPRNKDLTNCSPWKFVTGGNIVGGQMQIHNRGKDGMTVCPQQCIGRIF